MSLGERIYKLRTERNLSQGDLAEMLDVSRQSISKWENNSAVPDLDKIVKLSEIFGVSIDLLVKGEGDRDSHRSGAVDTSNRMENVVDAGGSQPTGFPPRMIAGTILLCMAFVLAVVFLAVGGGLVGFVLALPFLGCGIICFACKQNIGLWCSWLVYMLLDFYMRWATGINHSAIIGIVRNSVFYGKTWTLHAIFSVVLLLMLLVLIMITFRRFWKRPLVNSKKNLARLIIAWLVVAVVGVVFLILPYTGVYSIILKYIVSVGTIYQLVYTAVDWCRIIAFVYALTNTVRYVRTGKLAKEGEMS